MSEIELHVAEVYLDGLIDRVERGETATITRDGVPIARMVPVTTPARARDGGQAKAPAGRRPRQQPTP